MDCNNNRNNPSKSLAEIDAKEHIVEIRSEKFSIGAKNSNPLTFDLHRAVTRLSCELYTKDVHFLMELIQNAEDNDYVHEVEPTLELVLTKRDITGSGAPATLVVFNNEVGFSKQNMASLCSVGRSTKKGKRDQGFIGEKGIGFKSVFLVSKEPHIISNGYKVKFTEEPDHSCGIGYIVPEWVGDRSLISNIHNVYGSNRTIPTTTIVLPLKPEKVESVKEQLSQLHPELLLFLCKIKRLHVRSSSSYYKDASNICDISISHETDPVMMRSKKVESRVVHLAVGSSQGSDEKTCQYYMWKQSFPVKTENQVLSRDDVKEWTISLAFPVGDRLTRGVSSSVGIFAFLPTMMVTNFPFIIQADFLLSSSRESILLDNKWNLGILNCVPSAFLNAFTWCVKEGSTLFTTAKAFKFLPVEESSIAELDVVRENIKLMLCNEKIMPCEAFDNGLKFCKPLSALKVLPEFRQLLMRMKQNGISLDGLCSLRNHPVDASLDVEEFDKILDFLCVLPASESYGWYEKCLRACKIICQASETEYVDMLRIFANNEEVFSKNFFLRNQVFKYTDQTGQVQLCNACKTKKDCHRILFAMEPELHAWLNTCNMEFNCSGDVFFLPNSTQAALVAHEQSSVLIGWLFSHAKIECCTAYSYSLSLCDYNLNNIDQSLLLKLGHFLYHSFVKGFLSETDLSCLIMSIPIIDGSNTIRREKFKILVCKERSKWAILFGAQNLFSEHGYYDLGQIYAASGLFAGEYTPENSLLSFIEKYSEALDLPGLFPPNIALPIASQKLTSEQAFLLLDWVKFLRTDLKIALPSKFIASVRQGKWMKTNSGFNSPSNCVLPNKIGRRVFEMTSCVLGDFSILDETFYENRINLYLDELHYLGVTLGLNDVQKVVMMRFKAVASSEMSKTCVFSLLTFIGLLKERDMLDDGWLATMRKGKWLKTSQGSCAPSKSVFLQSESESEAVCRITSLPLIDRLFYGSKLDSFSTELALLGVTSDQEVYGLVADKFVLPEKPTFMTSDCGIFLLKCIRHLQSDATALIEKLKTQPWLKTSIGFVCPTSTVLPIPNLRILISIVEVPVVDEKYYGRSIQSYTSELKALGVGWDFNCALKIVASQIHELSSSSRLSPSNIISLLQCIRDMLNTMPDHLHQVREVLSEETLFKTYCGYRKPSESILSSQSWASISLFIDLPIIDDSYHGIDIYGFQDELEVLGVIVGMEEGAHFVANGLAKPIKGDQITAEGALTLLRSIRILMSQICETNFSLAPFLENIMASEFLKTSEGNRTPKQCVLLQQQWKNILQFTDLPFLDDIFYNNCMSEYENELESIGVKVDAVDVCLLLFESLYSLTDSSSVKRYYKFLSKYSGNLTSPDKGDDFLVWIPNQNDSDKGEWVSSTVCIVHDKDKLFHTLFHCLEIHYEEELLPIFPRAFNVAEVPGLNHYMQLWSSWLKREHRILTSSECHSFWSYILDNWNSETENFIKQNLTELPAVSPSASGIRLLSKEELFLPNDLLLKKMFMSLDDCPPFVWLPKGSISSSITPAKLQLVYDSLGVKRLSESVKLHVKTCSLLNQGSSTDLKNKLISRGLIMIVLAYLSGPKVYLDVKSRHEAAMSLLNLSVYESNGPLRVSYMLHLPSCKTLEVESRKVVHWDKESCTLLIDRSSYGSRKLTMELGSCFSQELAEGLLSRGKSVAVNDLRMIIQLAFDYEFQQDSVEFLLTRENLELLSEDEKVLSSAFPSEKHETEGSCKRIYPTTPLLLSKKQRY